MALPLETQFSPNARRLRPKSPSQLPLWLLRAAAEVSRKCTSHPLR
jgi:hypothetical protein